MRKIMMTLVGTLTIAAASTQALAMQQYVFQQSGTSFEYSLPPHDPQVFSNVFMWPVKASCKLSSKNPENSISFKVLRKEGSINDIKLASGDAMTLSFKPNDTIHISASSGGKVELTNNTEEMISAKCVSE